MSARPGHSRHRSREVALQVLYAIDVDRARAGGGVEADEAFDRVAAHFEMPAAARDFARELVCGSEARREEIDRVISAHARNWRIERMAAVDRNVLRLATYELAHGETPAAVVIDEGVELARRFGSDASPAFVNGIMDAVARSLRPVDVAPESRP